MPSEGIRSSQISNHKVDVEITLPAGNYKLRYKSDESHAFDHWNSLPPEINFWGIAVYKK